MGKLSCMTISRFLILTVTVGMAMHLSSSTTFLRAALAEDPQVQDAPGKVTEPGAVAEQTRPQEAPGEGAQQGAVAEETREGDKGVRNLCVDGAVPPG